MIHLLKTLLINGVMQTVSIHGANSNKPILLMLHGGPGMAQIGVARYFNPKLEENFVVVNWDQRGAGKSYHKNIPDSSMNTNQFVEDVITVSEYLCKTYNKKNIVLLGHSWGSAIGILAAQKRPDLFKSFIGVGQVVNIVEGQKISYQFVKDSATKTNDTKTLKVLEKLGQAPYTNIDKLKRLVTLIEKYNGAVYNGSINKLVKKGASTKEYSLWDWAWRFNKGINYSLKHLLPHTLLLDIKQSVPNISIPCYFIVGENDMQTPLALVQEYYNHLQAPSKQLYIIKKCAHMVPFEKVDEFSELIIDICR